jgi:hypothetical protein
VVHLLVSAVLKRQKKRKGTQRLLRLFKGLSLTGL